MTIDPHYTAKLALRKEKKQKKKGKKERILTKG